MWHWFHTHPGVYISTVTALHKWPLVIVFLFRQSVNSWLTATWWNFVLCLEPFSQYDTIQAMHILMHSSTLNADLLNWKVILSDDWFSSAHSKCNIQKCTGLIFKRNTKIFSLLHKSGVAWWTRRRKIVIYITAHRQLSSWWRAVCTQSRIFTTLCKP